MMIQASGADVPWFGMSRISLPDSRARTAGNCPLRDHSWTREDSGTQEAMSATSEAAGGIVAHGRDGHHRRT
jgi:hypothetical protein